MNRITLAAALTMGLLTTAAVAQTADEQQACMNDAFRVCSATIPDRARTTACMVQNKSQLSAACQTVMNRYAPANNAPVQTASAVPAKAVSNTRVKTASNTARAGKPLNIMAR